jgi:hypothetical protein
MIYRTFDPTLHNRIANIPSVAETVGFHAPDKCLDFTEMADRPDDYILLSDGQAAASLFEIRGPSVLDGHSIFAPECRGRDAIRTGRLMLDWLFCNTSALIITGATPIEFRAARWFNRQIGFHSDGIRMLNGEHWTHDMEYWHLLKSEWESNKLR